VVAAPLSALLRLPPHMLRRSVQATPFRFGFTAGAMMAGLALMVGIWTEGGAFLRDWLGKMEFPDAFVSGLILPQEAQDKVDALTEYVDGSVALSVIPVETDAFGVRALQRYQTNFIAFEPRRFFEMMDVTWVQGDEATATAALERGNAVIVAREFLTAQGLGMGDRFTCRFEGVEHEFEIVGVVTSPGLELISRFFNIGEEFTAQAVHAVFGSREDSREKFGVDAIRVIAIDLRDGVSDAEAIAALRRELFPYGIADAGSGRAMKHDIVRFVEGTLLVFSGIAVMAMLVACFGVANLVVAGIELRRFEFGVLRAVGAQSGLLVRLVLGEAAIIALTASILGTVMGIQAAYASTRLQALLFGILLELKPPPLPILAGWGFVFALTLAAATPPVRRLARRHPRELLAAMRG
jgi:putative ABC transport system permease protein